jgi:hypothetical protein
MFACRRARFRGDSHTVSMGLRWRLQRRVPVSGDRAYAKTANSQCADKCKDQNHVSLPQPSMRNTLRLTIGGTVSSRVTNRNYPFLVQTKRVSLSDQSIGPEKMGYAATVEPILT